MTDVLAKFVAYTGKRLPDDVRAKIRELAAQEDAPLAKSIYETMEKNQELAMKLNRPSCQDTGAAQFFLKCGSNFPYMAEMEGILHTAVVQATAEAPLRRCRRRMRRGDCRCELARPRHAGDTLDVQGEGVWPPHRLH